MSLVARLVAVAALLSFGVVSGYAQSFSGAQKSEIEKIIREYLIANPEVLQEAIAALEKKQAADEAVTLLRTALAREPELPEGYTQLAMAYGRKGDLAQADLAAAQAAFMRGDIKTARELGARAKTRFPVGSPGWVKADDLVITKPAKSGF